MVLLLTVSHSASSLRCSLNTGCLLPTETALTMSLSAHLLCCCCCCLLLRTRRGTRRRTARAAGTRARLVTTSPLRSGRSSSREALTPRELPLPHVHFAVPSFPAIPPAWT